MTRARFALLVAMTAIASGCASAPTVPAVTTPKFPGYVEPAVPTTARIPADLKQRHDLAWRWLQAGNPRRASRDYQFVLKRLPGFVPSVTGLGYTELAERNFKAAATQFAAALAKDNAYLPAWVGRAEVDVAVGDDDAAIASLERLLQLDPTRQGVAARLDLVRFRRVQSLIEQGRAARAAGKFADAQRTLENALELSPLSSMILAELVVLEHQTGALDRAETHGRRLVQLDPGTAEHLALLAGVLEARGKIADAATFYARAAAIEPRDNWRAKAASLREKAAVAARPEVVRTMPTAVSFTRGEAAAYIGTELESLIAKAPARPIQVATDVRSHWAARWIAAVTRAGVMRLYDNHTFQPGTTVRRGDLAEIAANLVELAAAGRASDLVGWRAARPRFTDLPATHVSYRPAALAVAAGVLNADGAGRFQPTRLATGAELVSAVDRITQLTQRR